MATLNSPKSQRNLKSLIPILEWLPKYDTSWIRWDIIAALTVWALLVPEAMAYAGIAGMPPQTGLYTAPLALLGYAIFGTSRHLNVGPSSTVAILSFAIIGGMAVAGGPEFIALTTGLAIMTGLLLILAGLLKLGVMADFLSKPVLGGFIIGLAITIAFGQVGKILGYNVEANGFFREVAQFVLQINLIHIPTLIVGTLSLAALFLMHKYTPKIPAAITVLIVAILFSAGLKLHDNYGVHIVGEIPAGLPPFGLPDLSVRQYIQLIPGAIAVALVGFAESVAAARSYASRFGYEVDANQEMVGLGVANLGSGVSGGFVVDGSLSKTAASVSAGAKSQMVSIFAAIFILITILFLTPLFYHLPEAVLGAIVIHAVWKLISFEKLKRYYAISRADFWAALVALLGVLVLGLLGGLLLAVLVSLVALLITVKNPRAVILGKLPGLNAFRSLEQFPEAETYPGLLIFRFDSLLFFANAPNFRERLEAALQQIPDTQVIIVDGEPINYVDITAIDMLNELHDHLQEQSIQLWFSGITRPVYETLERGGVVDKIGRDHFFASLGDAVEAYLREATETVDQQNP